jgi:hypothetical protein
MDAHDEKRGGLGDGGVMENSVRPVSPLSPIEDDMSIQVSEARLNSRFNTLAETTRRWPPAVGDAALAD